MIKDKYINKTSPEPVKKYDLCLESSCRFQLCLGDFFIHMNNELQEIQVYNYASIKEGSRRYNGTLIERKKDLTNKLNYDRNL